MRLEELSPVAGQRLRYTAECSGLQGVDIVVPDDNCVNAITSNYSGALLVLENVAGAISFSLVRGEIFGDDNSFELVGQAPCLDG